MKTDLAAFPDFISADGDLPESELGDAFGKFIEENAVAATINHPRAHALLESFRATSAERNKPMVEHYAKIAAAATKTTTPAPATLAKRFSSDEKAGYRKYFQENLEKGKTASATLAEWNSEFPHANPSIAKLMAEVAAEFQ